MSRIAHWSSALRVRDDTWHAVSILKERSASDSRRERERLERAVKAAAATSSSSSSSSSHGEDSSDSSSTALLGVLSADVWDEQRDELFGEYLIQWVPPLDECDEYPSARSAQVWWTRLDLLPAALGTPEATDDTWFEFESANQLDDHDEDDDDDDELLASNQTGMDPNDSTTREEPALPAPELGVDEFEEGIPSNRAVILLKQFYRRGAVAAAVAAVAEREARAAKLRAARLEHYSSQANGSQTDARDFSFMQALEEAERFDPTLALEDLELVMMLGRSWLADRRNYWRKQGIYGLRDALEKLTDRRENGATRRKRDLTHHVIYLEARKSFMDSKEREHELSEQLRFSKICVPVGRTNFASRFGRYLGFSVFDQELLVLATSRAVTTYAFDSIDSTVLHEQQSIPLNYDCTFVCARRTDHGDFAYFAYPKSQLENPHVVLRVMNLETLASTVVAFLFPMKYPLRRGDSYFNWATATLSKVCVVDSGLVISLDSGGLFELALDMDALERGDGFEAEAPRRGTGFFATLAYHDPYRDLSGLEQICFSDSGVANISLADSRAAPLCSELFDSSHLSILGVIQLLASADAGNLYAGCTQEGYVFLGRFGDAAFFRSLHVPVDLQVPQQQRYNCITFSPTGSHFAIGAGPSTVWLFDVERFGAGLSAAACYQIPKPWLTLSSVTITLDGFMAVAGNHRVSVFSLDSTEMIYRLTRKKKKSGDLSQVVASTLLALSRVSVGGRDMFLVIKERYGGRYHVNVWSPEGDSFSKPAR